MSQSIKQVDAWQRDMILWHFAAGVVSVIALIFSLTDEALTYPTLMMVLLAAFVGWYTLGIYWKSRPRSNLALSGYLILGWILWFFLTGHSLVYMILLFILIPQLFMTLSLRWSAIHSIVLNGFIIIRFNEINPASATTWLLISTIMVMTSVVLAAYIERIIRQSDERRELIHTLEATRQDLANAQYKAGILQERQRLARELHDTLAQGFTSIVMHLEAAEANPPEQVHHIEQAKTMARANLKNIRSVVWALREEISNTRNFEECLQQIILNWSQSNRIQVDFDVIGDALAIIDHAQHIAIRVTQEALSNIHKHAHASQVIVTLTYLDDLILLDIQDNGIGFDTSIPYNGFGLSIMRERAQEIGANLAIESTPQQGSTIALSLPVSQKANT